MVKLFKTVCFFGLIVACQQNKKIIFEDNFDGEKLNELHWNYQLGNGCPELCGWGNNELQIYNKTNASVQDGHLIIKASKEDSIYYSSRLTTARKIEFQYGIIEVRAKLPTGVGVWPAIWMLGSDISEVGWPACGEIDIMEYVGKKTGEIHNTLHTPDSFGQSKNTAITTIDDIEIGFHTYKAHWTKDFIKFYVDENLTYTFSPEVKNGKTWPYNKPHFLLLNLAIGGNFGGPEVDDSIFPQEFIIDYVKIYDL